MADNTTLNLGSGGDVIASDDIAGVKYQRVKLSCGADGSATDVPVGGGVEAAALRVTLASDSTGVLSVDDNGGSLTVDGTVTANLAAGTNNIGDVDVLSVVPGTGATSLGKAIDSVPGATDTGVAALAVRDDALATLTPADGDYTHLRVDSTGAQWVRVTNGITGLVDDAAFTPATSEVLPIGFFADEIATDSVDEGDAGAARMTLDRKQIVTPYVHAAAGGAEPYKNIDVDETEDDIKTSAGKLYWLHVMNLHASSNRFLKVYNNVAASVTVGTTVPDLTFPIPPNTAGFTLNFGTQGLQFSTGICIAATTGLADNDAGAPGANEVVVNAGYA